MRFVYCDLVRTASVFSEKRARLTDMWIQTYGATRDQPYVVKSDYYVDAKESTAIAPIRPHTHTHTHTQTAISRGSFVRQPCRHSRCRSASARRGKYRIAVREWKPEVTGTVINRPSRRQQHSATTDEVAPRPPTELSRAIVTTWLRDVASNYRSRGC